MRTCRWMLVAIGLMVVFLLPGCGGGGGQGPAEVVGILQGVVEDAATGDPVPDAYMYIPAPPRAGQEPLASSGRQQQLETSSNSRGEFRIEHVPVGETVALHVERGQAALDFVPLVTEETLTRDQPVRSRRLGVTPRVIDVVLTGIDLHPGSATLRVGDTVQFTAAPVGYGGQLRGAWWATGGAGFVDDNGLFAATAEGTATVHVAMGSQRVDATVTVAGRTDTATLAIETFPLGAHILLDASDTGRTAPTTFTGLSAGTHTVRLEAAGYEPFEGSLQLAAGETVILRVTMPALALGNIEVRSVPQGATIILDGVPQPVVTNAVLGPLPAGPHTVRLELAGYTPAERTVEVQAGATTVVELQLEHVPGVASVVVTPNNSQSDPLNVTAGNTVQFSAQAYDGGGNPLAVAVTWSVTGSIGSIDQTGLFAATQTTSSANPARGTVSATCEAVSASVNVAVIVGEVTRLVISWPQGVDLNSIEVGHTVQFTAQGEDQFGNRGNKRRIAVSPSWEVSGGIGTIAQNGLFTATTAGSGQVTASLTTPQISQSVQVTVVPPPNRPPQITQLAANPTSVLRGGTSVITCTAQDPDGDSLTYVWQGSGGTISGSGAQVTWTAPSTVGNFTVTCTVSDGRGGSDSEIVTVAVIAGQPPDITALTADPTDVPPGGTALLRCTAQDAEGDPFTYTWSASGGAITGSGQEVTWQAPSTVGTYTITCTVADWDGTDSQQVTVTVTSTTVIVG